jgi:hypothetical protein
MKYLKLFENFYQSEKGIKIFCAIHKIKSYKINPDGSIEYTYI